MNTSWSKTISFFGNGENIRDWLYVEDHINALLLVSEKGMNGKTYCIGAREEKTNKEIVENICEILDNLVPKKCSYKNLINLEEE